MKKHLGNIIKLLVGALISTLLILYLVNKIDYEKTKEIIFDIDWTFFIVMIICSGLSHISRGLRWSILLEDQGMIVSKKGLIAGTFVGYFINIVFPRAGEVARCTSVSYKYGLPADKLLGTVVLERVIDMFMLLSCIGLVLFLDFDLFGGFFEERWIELNNMFSNLIPILIGLLVTGIIGLFFLFKYRNRISLFTKVYTFFKGIIEGLLSLRKLKRKGLFIFHTLFIWIMYLSMSYIPFRAFQAIENYDVTKALFVFILGGIGMTIPAPGGIGSYQYVVITGMTNVLNTVEEVAAAYAFSVHTILTLFTITAGIIASIYLFKGKKHDGLSTSE